MKCKNCGGQINLQKETGFCSNCGCQYNLKHIFEDNDVTILSINTDERGAKSQDSIIAKEVYRKLESVKISTFYELISAEASFGGEYEELKLTALLKSKIVILIGTSAENFNILLNKYYDVIKGKKIIPIFCDVSPDKIPEEIKKLQCLNYNAIAFDSDLKNGVFTLLGKEHSFDFSEQQRKASKSKTIFLGVVIAVSILMLGLGSFFVYDFLSEKDEPIELTLQEKYELAQTYIKDKQFSNAIIALSEIIDYKESKSLLKNIYDKYDGYYLSNDGFYSLFLDIQGTDSTTISFTKNVSSTKKIYFEESCTIEGTVATLTYTDNSAQTGICTVELKNDNVYVTIKSKSDSSDNSNTIEQHFELSNKTDEPNIEKITRTNIINWLNNKTSLNELTQLGYEFQHHMTFTGYSLEDWTHIYKLKDQDLYAVFINFDIAVAYEFSDSLMDYWDWCVYGDGPDIPLKDPVLFAIVTSAGILYPELIGQSINNIDYSEANIAHNIDTNFSLDFPSGVFKEVDEPSNIISADMFFTVTTDTSTAGQKYSTHNYSSFSIMALDTMYVAVEEGLNLRKQPSTDSDVITVMSEGQSVDILEYDSTGVWVKVRCGSLVGYCVIEYLSNSAPVTYQSNTSNTIKITSGIYHVYKGPSYKSDLIQSLPTGTFTIVEKQNDENGKQWGRLKSGIGWICLTDIR